MRGLFFWRGADDLCKPSNSDGKIKDGTREDILALRPQGKVWRGTLACKCDIFVVCCGVGGFGVGLKFWRGIRFWRGSAISLQDSGVEDSLG